MLNIHQNVHKGKVNVDEKHNVEQLRSFHVFFVQNVE